MVLYVVCLFLLLPLCCFQSCDSRSFTIDYDHNCFLKDGEPFRYISGGMHYFRVPQNYWKDRLLKMKAAGLNAVQTYVAWNVHEPIEGQYNFRGDADLASFIKLADSLGMLVIVRAGPYICAEWDFGGFPGWLLKNTSIVLRSLKDQQYISAVKSWMSVLLPLLRPLLYANGGPIISVQVENEYGYWKACDHDYMTYLGQLFRQYLGNDVVLFTVDGDQDSLMKCGSISSLYATVDFGPNEDPEKAFAVMRNFQPKGPLVNTEFYTGWLDHWGEKHQTKSSDLVAKALDKILSMNASLNFYMFEGGTNFGYMNGAEYDNNTYAPVPTSYDYDAPLTEAGDPTEKYFLLREVIAKYQKIEPIPIPPATPKYAYGKVQMTELSGVLDALPHITPLGPIKAPLPLTMEQLGQNYGFVLYRTQIPLTFAQCETMLNVTELVRDRAIVYVGKLQQGILNRTKGESNMMLTIGEFLELDILVENMGRVGFSEYMNDPKGIIGDVTLNGTTFLYDWEMYAIDFTNLGNMLKSPLVSNRKKRGTDVVRNSFAPTIFMGEVPADPYGSYDSYLQLKGWSKGQVFINGVNIGRYWPVVGPQQTLYIPGSVMSTGASKLMLVELDNSPCEFPETCFVEFVSIPAINGTVNPIMKSSTKFGGYGGAH